jgi:hypothetical protein
MSLDNANAAEKEHMARIKSLPCGVCDEPGPSDAHHITDCGRRVSHYATIPLCKSCHQDARNGIHGMGIMWKVMKKTDLLVLAETIEKLK